MILIGILLLGGLRDRAHGRRGRACSQPAPLELWRGRDVSQACLRWAAAHRADGDDAVRLRTLSAIRLAEAIAASEEWSGS